MSDFQAMVRLFHEASGQEVASAPTLGTEALRALRCRLLLEEVLEFIEASGCVIVHKGDGRMGVESMPTFDAPDMARMAHELADVQYVVAGAAVALGFPLEKVFAEVHAANMRKAPGGKVERRADGKILKPADWRPADVAKLLEETAP